MRGCGMLGAWLTSSALWSRLRIVLVWRRSWPIATAPKSTWRGLGSSWHRRRGRASPRSPGAPWSAGRWCGVQRRFAEAGVDGLLREASRKPGKAPLGDATVQRVVALTCAEPPGEVTHWTGRAMANDRDLLALGPTDLAGTQTAATPHPHLQALERSRLRRQARGCGRPLHGAAQARPGALDRREIADPGARSHPAGPAAQAGQSRQHDARYNATAPRRSLLPSMFSRAP